MCYLCDLFCNSEMMVAMLVSISKVILLFFVIFSLMKELI